MLDVNVKQKDFYAWQSILKARDLVRLGSSWRIGDGKSVLIRDDKWIPGQQTGRVISPQKLLPCNARVCALIDEDNPSWIANRVQEEFLPFEAEAIHSLPLSARSTEDTLIWQGTKNGNYSTKCLSYPGWRVKCIKTGSIKSTGSQEFLAETMDPRCTKQGQTFHVESVQ